MKHNQFKKGILGTEVIRYDENGNAISTFLAYYSPTCITLKGLDDTYEWSVRAMDDSFSIPITHLSAPFSPAYLGTWEETHAFITRCIAKGKLEDADFDRRFPDNPDFDWPMAPFNPTCEGA